MSDKPNTFKPAPATEPDPKPQPVKEPPGIEPTQPVPQKTEPKQLGPKEFGGPKGLEPTRYGDWEQKGRCTDF